MPDIRFFEPLGPVTLAELAQASGASLARGSDGDRRIWGAAPLGRATQSDVSFVADKRHAPLLASTAAGACFVGPAHVDQLREGCAALVSAEPQAAYARAAARLFRPRRHLSHGTPVAADAVLEPDVVLGFGVVIGPGVAVGAGTEIGAHAVVGPGVQIGRGCRIGANSTLGFALIGDGVRVLAGAVIGEEGFGVTAASTGALDMPQLGRVILQDGVTVGANACIDRGAYDDTVIGENTKIENLVQIAHNVVIGRNCVLAAHTGISGSVTVGDGAMFGGRAGIADHVDIGAGARIAAAAGVMKSVPPGEVWGGSPARPLRKWMRETAWLGRQAEKGGRGG